MTYYVTICKTCTTTIPIEAESSNQALSIVTQELCDNASTALQNDEDWDNVQTSLNCISCPQPYLGYCDSDV